MSDSPAIKSLRAAEPRAGVDEYLTRKITGGRSAYKASLDILLCHMADFHRLMLGIICRKHGLDFDEVLAEIEGDEEYVNMMVNPAVYAMRHLDEEELAIDSGAVVETPVEPPKKPRRKIKFVAEDDGREAEENAVANATVYFDGGARGNPGPAGAGAVLVGSDSSKSRAGKFIPHATNNVAEYTALLLGLDLAASAGYTDIEVRGDSQLVINHMTGTYKAKSSNLMALYKEAKEKVEKFKSVKFVHVPRAENGEADALANRCMDEKADIVGDDSGEATEAVTEPGTKQVQLTGEAATAAKATAAAGRKVIVKKKASKPKATEEA